MFHDKVTLKGSSNGLLPENIIRLLQQRTIFVDCRTEISSNILLIFFIFSKYGNKIVTALFEEIV